MKRLVLRLLALLLLSALSLQLFFLARIALMVVVDPQSTAFQRSEAWRLLVEKHELAWSQEWSDRVSPHLGRAVIASEDAGFAEHGGVEWDAIEKAWERNQKSEARAEKLNEQAEKRAANGKVATPARKVEAKVVGGSTISQQLAKNLFLSGERTAPRKAQEFLITFMLEALLGKQRILAIYLNSVEWGEGVFGAQAAARHYFRVDAAQLGPAQAARLAVMLPAPKRFEKNPGSAYVAGRSATIQARMGAVELP
ncbi:transglycosylase domain-containing protein [Ideonella sp. 4Y16]|uniref:transglycosylase domain-containing protein n=1 Tax=Ideonella alba TaxID=2824118 RepID=UPI001B38EAA7|nr:transglycosylase domain-containing protein [Ideonella alba]MBQ0944683.1 transglycosylase domain-containing protein [Ideonella alba]